MRGREGEHVEGRKLLICDRRRVRTLWDGQRMNKEIETHKWRENNRKQNQERNYMKIKEINDIRE